MLIYQKNLKFLKNTVSKWKNRTFFEDRSSRPNNIEYSLSFDEKLILIHLRSSTWWAIDEIVELVYGEQAKSKRSAVYRLFKANSINTVPQEKKEQAKKYSRNIHQDIYILMLLNYPKLME